MMARMSWGAAWIEQLVLGNTFDGPELARGRGLAARGGVVDVSIEPAAVSATVRGRAAADRRVRIGFRRLSDEQWSTVRSVVARSSRTVASMLDGDLPTELHDQLVDVGCTLLPGVRDVSIDCSCGNLAESCVHAAAACCHLAGELDRDPVLLVTLRGGDRSEILAGLVPTGAAGRRRGGGGGAQRMSAIGGRGPDPGVPAAAAWKRRPADLPVDFGRRRLPDGPRSGVVAPPADLGFDAVGLERLVADAAARAASCLDASDPVAESGLDLDGGLDAVRRCAAGRLGASTVAEVLGCDRSSVDGLVDAWRHAGSAGVEVLTRPRRMSDSELALLADVIEDDVRSRSTGAVIGGGRQVRRSTDGSWVLLAGDAEGGLRVIDVASCPGDLDL